MPIDPVGTRCFTADLVMRAVAVVPAFLLLFIVACESKSTAMPESSARAKPEVVAKSTSSGSAASAAPSPKPPPSAAAPPSAAPPAGPCPADAKRYDEPRFCVVLPEKTLDITYEGGPEEGNAELQDRNGGVLRFSWVPAARAGEQSLEAQVERVGAGEELVASGDIPGGAWSEIKQVGDAASGKRYVQSLTKSQKVLVNCHYTVESEHSEQARAVCKSVRTY
jgi:hypothetical protein